MGSGKVKEAVYSISRCVGRLGFYASSDRYKYEYWTRDLFYSLKPLIRLGLGGKAKQHLLEIWREQRKDGSLPRYFLDRRYKWAPRKFYMELRGRKFLRTIRVRDTVETRYRHWTVDSTILAVLATYEFSRMTEDRELLAKLEKKINLAMKNIRSALVDGLVRGGDWRDSLPELGFKFLLSNNVMLYSLYSAAGKEKEAARLKRAVNTAFWKGRGYIDFIGGRNIDPLGLSFAVLSGVVSRSRYGPVSRQLMSSSSRYGILSNVDVDSVWDLKMINLASCNHIHSVWPFVSYYAVLALNMMGKFREAKEEAEKVERLHGFYEWYDPNTGGHHGSRDQLWNAAMYVEEKIRI